VSYLLSPTWDQAGSLKILREIGSLPHGCFDNAIRVCQVYGLSYCEGEVWKERSMRPAFHAFNLLGDRVIDISVYKNDNGGIRHYRIFEIYQPADVFMMLARGEIPPFDGEGYEDKLSIIDRLVATTALREV
jgi:hypothetical protein